MKALIDVINQLSYLVHIRCNCFYIVKCSNDVLMRRFITQEGRYEIMRLAYLAIVSNYSS